ncbi:MAG: ABC transporter ATP-binding protein [Planctomycetota bacterium]|nr:ABC transporter ATP-binding protein [Planctomycetota bacterium]
MSFLALEKLEKRWPDGTHAVRGVDLAISEGELVVLLGPSGCGKTTTLRMVAGLEMPSAGRVRLGGADVTALPPSQRDVGFVFQFYALYPHMTVAENIAFPLECAGVARPERDAAVQRVAERLDLVALLGRRPRALSGGDQQRVGLARAMVRKPRLWLMDEPLGSLDAARRAEMCELIRVQQLADRVTTIYVTHDQEEAMRLADRIVVMSQGEIVQAAPPREVYDRPATLFVAKFVGSPGMNLIEGDVRAGRFVPAGAHASIALPNAVADGRVVLGARPEHLRLDPAGALRGRVALEAHAGPWRHVHVEGPWGRALALTSAHETHATGAEVRVAFDPAGIRLFDAASGRSLA